MFSHLKEVPQDPILQAAQMFAQDPRENKIDLGIGVYKNEKGITPIMSAVKEAEYHLWQEQKSKAYVSVAGDAVFNDAIVTLVKGDAIPAQRQVASVQALGGTGAVRLLLELARVSNADTTVWIPQDTWPNHKAIAGRLGLKHASYPYLDRKTMQVDEDAVLSTLKKVPAGDIVVIHGCCHNPTGADFSLDIWQKLADMAANQGWTPLVDIAYIGFAHGIEQDLAGARLMAHSVRECLMAFSCSKNFGLYRERVGCALIFGDKDLTAARGTMMSLARTSYSMPADHGARLVGLILTSPDLKDQWCSELEDYRVRMCQLRKHLKQALVQQALVQGGQRDPQRFDFITHHNGMFSLLPLTREQVDTLRRDHAIYLVGAGRVNIAGLSEDTMPPLATALLAVGF